MVHTAPWSSHPSGDTASPGTCIRIQLLGGHLRSPLPDEPPDTYLQPGLTPDRARLLEGPRSAAVVGLAASHQHAHCARAALPLGRGSLALEVTAPVPAEEAGVSSASVLRLVRGVGTIWRTKWWRSPRGKRLRSAVACEAGVETTGSVCGIQRTAECRGSSTRTGSAIRRQ